MSSLKNWFVRSERVQERHIGLIRYCKYLNDQNHSNHKEKTVILPLYGKAESFISNCTFQAVQLDQKNANRKGGRPVSSYAQSFTFVLPASVKPPELAQWKLIFSDTIRAMSEKIEMPLDKLKGLVFSNIHDQDNPHMNIVISRVLNEQHIKKLDHRSLIVTAKKAFTLSTLKHCGLDINHYVPIQTNLGRRQTNWQRQQAEAQIQIKAASDAVKKLEEEIDKAKHLSKFSAMLNCQTQKWIIAIGEGNTQQEDRQANRINNTINNINELNISEETAALIEQLVEAAEKKAGKPITIKNKYKARPWSS